MKDPIEFSVDTARRLIVMRFANDVGDVEILGRMREIFGLEELDPAFDTVVDLRAVSSSTLSGQGFSGVAAIARDFRAGVGADDPRPRTALLVSSELAFGLARQYQQLAEDVYTRIKVFRDVEELYRWLDVAPGDVAL